MKKRKRGRPRQKYCVTKQEWYKHYQKAKTRCNNKNHINYKNYGGRGIKCLLTKEDIKYLWFRDKAYLLKRPSIDRKNNNGNYTLKNCRFIELSKNISRANKGVKNYFSKLTGTQVRRIRRLYITQDISSRELARKFNISKTNILDIINRHIWGHI